MVSQDWRMWRITSTGPDWARDLPCVRGGVVSRAAAVILGAHAVLAFPGMFWFEASGNSYRRVGPRQKRRLDRVVEARMSFY